MATSPLPFLLNGVNSDQLGVSTNRNLVLVSDNFASQMADIGLPCQRLLVPETIGAETYTHQLPYQAIGKLPGGHAVALSLRNALETRHWQKLQPVEDASKPAASMLQSLLHFADGNRLVVEKRRGVETIVALGAALDYLREKSIVTSRHMMPSHGLKDDERASLKQALGDNSHYETLMTRLRRHQMTQDFRSK